MSSEPADLHTRLPDFLLIGAMRAGTTTLFSDLNQHPELFGAPGKEPHILLKEDIHPAGQHEQYASLFRGARPDQRCFEASTGYTKRPVFEGVAEQARHVIGPNLKAIYIVRDPIKRAISHHHYHLRDPRIAENFDRAVAEWSELTDFGRYATQVEPWIETFGRDHILLIRFEDYIHHRQSTLRRICRFLGLSDTHVSANPQAPHNASTANRYPTGPWAWLAHRAAFRRHVRNRLPEPLVTAVKRWTFKPAPLKPAPPSPDTIDRLIDVFKPEADRLARLMGDQAPLWDFQATRDELTRPAKDPQRVS